MIQNNIPQFKVWDNDNRQWLEDCFLSQNGEVLQKRPYGRMQNMEYFTIKNTTICRFTGLFDKNNTPIYENDILIVGKINYRDEKNNYCLKNDYLLIEQKISKFDANPYCGGGAGSKFSYAIYGIDKNYPVIAGNKFENPELLGQSDEN